MGQEGSEQLADRALDVGTRTQGVRRKRIPVHAGRMAGPALALAPHLGCLGTDYLMAATPSFISLMPWSTVTFSVMMSSWARLSTNSYSAAFGSTGSSR